MTELRSEEDPSVRFTVKELIVQINTKLDLYIAQQDQLRQTVDHLAPAVASLDTRVEGLELAALKKAAVSDWRKRGWALLMGSSGLLALGAIILAFVHH